MVTYSTHILPFKHLYKKVVIPQKKLIKIREFVSQLVLEKEKELHHKIDSRSHFKRFFTGTIGEAALEEYLGIDNIINWNIGRSLNFHTPDLNNLGIKAGIKTVEYGLFPIIFKKSYNPEIIMIKKSENQVIVCGLATKDVLNKFQSDELIKDQYLRLRGTKTGFYGFEYLKQFSSLKELKKLV